MDNSDLFQDNTLRDTEPTLDSETFLPVFRSAIRKKLASKAIGTKRATMFDITCKLILASVASEEFLRNIGLGNRQLCIITAPINAHNKFLFYTFRLSHGNLTIFKIKFKKLVRFP